MSISRRRFLRTTTCAGVGIAVRQPVLPDSLLASVSDWDIQSDLTGERVAYTPATWYRPYRSKIASAADLRTWVQVDLGSTKPIDTIKLYPVYQGFPVRFKVEISDDPSLASARKIADRTQDDYPNPIDQVVGFRTEGVRGRYVRLTVTRARLLWRADIYGFALRKLEVISRGKDIAERCPVTADTTFGNPSDFAQLTRPPRPMGECVVTDHPENVSDPLTWRPVAYRLNAPLSGVSLQGGVFETAMENNIQYLLESFSVDDLLNEFRNRAGKPNPSPLKDSRSFWIYDLPGSNAGRFLMGAGNTLRWIQHEELRLRLNAVIDGIEECRQPDGHIMAFPEDTIFVSERGGYTCAWLTHGLIEAGYAGNPKAFQLLRGYYDWFNKCPYLPELMRRAGQGIQGMIANARMYFTPVGKPEDIQLVQRYFQENYWLDGLAKREEAMVWQYPYDRPHCYLLTDFEAYLDLYRATGDKRYLDAMLGGWNLFHDQWEHVGGTIAIVEEEEDPPKSYRLHGVPRMYGGDAVQTGELCGSVFWTLFNQRLHYLDPEREAYVTEIEKSIYNAALANQDASRGIIYHAKLLGTKEESTRINSCCEGQGTRLYSSLPEHIYSIASDGLYVDLFEPSTIRWSQAGDPLELTMATKFPFDPEVELHFSLAGPVRTKIRVRVPSWAAKEMQIHINGVGTSVGKPGTYVTSDRQWSDRDTISFTLPIELRITRYTGVEQIAGHQRYAVEYGPILLAAAGSEEATLRVVNAKRHEDIPGQLQPKPNRPLHFSDPQNPGIEFMPYCQVSMETFTCFPVIDIGAEA